MGRAGPRPAASPCGWAIFKRYKPVLDAIGDQAYYVGPIGAGSIAKLVHNCAGYVIQTALAEVFTMGVKAGVDPLGLWKAVRQGRGAGVGRSTAWSISSCPARSSPRRSRCGWPTRT